MARIESVPPFPHLLFEKPGWRGMPLDILVVRGTFDLVDDGEIMQIAAMQTPLNWGDVCDAPADTDPFGAALKDDSDLIAGKAGADIILSGHLHSPDGRPVSDWLAGVRIGSFSKGVRVTGPRRFERGLLGWRVTPAQTVDKVAIDYRLAFGGRIQLPCNGDLCETMFASNPVGTGWLPDQRDIKSLSKAQQRTIQAWVKSQRSLTAPQFEHFSTALRHPYERPVPQGFGPIARWWQPRLGYQGTLDDRWRQERYPAPPDDYDPRFLQSAHPEMTLPHFLVGDEIVELIQCYAAGNLSNRLPGLEVQAMVVFANGAHIIQPLGLDTLRIDLDRKQCNLVWRTQFDHRNPPQDITITCLPLQSIQRAIGTGTPHG